MKPICILLQNHYEIDLRVRRKAEALVAAGYSVDVLALRSSYSKSKDYTLDGVNIYTVDLGKNRGSIARYVYSTSRFWSGVSSRCLPSCGEGNTALSTRTTFLTSWSSQGRTRSGKARRLSSTCTRSLRSSIFPSTESRRTRGWSRF